MKKDGSLNGEDKVEESDNDGIRFPRLVSIDEMY